MRNEYTYLLLLHSLNSKVSNGITLKQRVEKLACKYIHIVNILSKRKTFQLYAVVYNLSQNQRQRSVQCASN